MRESATALASDPRRRLVHLPGLTSVLRSVRAPVLRPPSFVMFSQAWPWGLGLRCLLGRYPKAGSGSGLICGALAPVMPGSLPRSGMPCFRRRRSLANGRRSRTRALLCPGTYRTRALHRARHRL
ncbi:hypothetical protein GCM10010402_38680 [Actinomadura luteofluorescens]